MSLYSVVQQMKVISNVVVLKQNNVAIRSLLIKFLLEIFRNCCSRNGGFI